MADASAVVAYLANFPAGSGQLARRRFTGEELHAPHLLDVEVSHAHYPLAPRVWALRHNLTAYDATYVALAEELGLRLITFDRRIREAPGHQAVVEVL